MNQKVTPRGIDMLLFTENSLKAILYKERYYPGVTFYVMREYFTKYSGVSGYFSDLLFSCLPS